MDEKYGGGMGYRTEQRCVAWPTPSVPGGFYRPAGYPTYVGQKVTFESLLPVLGTGIGPKQWSSFFGQLADFHGISGILVIFIKIVNFWKIDFLQKVKKVEKVEIYKIYKNHKIEKFSKILAFLEKIWKKWRTLKT